MESWVLSECGIRPLPQVFPKPRTGLNSNAIANTSNQFKIGFLQPKPDPRIRSLRSSSGGFSRDRNWVLNVSAPLNLVTEEKERTVNGGLLGEEDEFDPGSPPPFIFAEIRASIPKHCWVKNPWKSMSYVVRDVTIVFGLDATAAYLNNWLVWPLYWAAQGTMFWALFVLGHDCGHGSFSNNHILNSVVGHLLHSSILVPYHGWRISHRTHHQNHGHVQNDESWHPLSEKIYNKLDNIAKTFRFKAPFPMLAYPFYIWGRSPGKSGSHFNPSNDLFIPSENKDVITSTLCWTAMASLLVGLCFVMGPLQVLKLYGVPYWYTWWKIVHFAVVPKVPRYPLYSCCLLLVDLDSSADRGTMGHRHLPNSLPVLTGQSQNSYDPTSEHSYTGTGRVVGLENGSLAYPIDTVSRGGMQRASHWNSERMRNDYRPSSFTTGVPNIQSALSGASHDPFPHSSDPRSSHLPQEGSTGFSQSYYYDRCYGYESELSSASNIARRQLKRSPEIYVACERGSTTRFPVADFL